jgi:hypothetical protein
VHGISRTISVGFHEYDLYLYFEPIPDAAQRLWYLDDPFFARAFAHRLGSDPLSHMVVNAFLAELPLIDEPWLWGKDAMQSRLARAFERGWLVATVHEHQPVQLVPLQKKEVEEEAVAKDGQTYRCSVQVVLDTTDEPLKDIRLTLRLADGTEVEVATDADGLAELDDAYRGKFSVTSIVLDATVDETFSFVKSGATPSSGTAGNAGENEESPTGTWLARVIEYRMQPGDTLESVAAAHNLTADGLAYFNWKTTDRGEINSYLYYRAGCRLVEDGGTYVCDDSDEAGIIHIPLPWSANGLPHDQTYIIRAKPVEEPVAPFAFSV